MLFKPKRTKQASPADTCLTLCGVLPGTAAFAALWAKVVWPAMARGGVDFTGRVLITVFLSAEFSCCGGIATALLIGCCIGGVKLCCDGKTNEKSARIRELIQQEAEAERKKALSRNSQHQEVVLDVEAVNAIENITSEALATVQKSVVGIQERLEKEAKEEIEQVKELVELFDKQKISAEVFQAHFQMILESLRDKKLIAKHAILDAKELVKKDQASGDVVLDIQETAVNDNNPSSSGVVASFRK